MGRKGKIYGLKRGRHLNYSLGRSCRSFGSRIVRVEPRYPGFCTLALISHLMWIALRRSRILVKEAVLSRVNSWNGWHLKAICQQHPQSVRQRNVHWKRIWTAHYSIHCSLPIMPLWTTSSSMFWSSSSRFWWMSLPDAKHKRRIARKNNSHQYSISGPRLILIISLLHYPYWSPALQLGSLQDRVAYLVTWTRPLWLTVLFGNWSF